MTKKLSLALVMIASLIFSAGATMTAFAEDDKDGVSVSADASVNINSDDRWDDDMDKGDRKDGWMEEREDMREERRGFFDAFRSKKAEVRNDIRMDIKQTRRGLIDARWKIIGGAFSNIIIRIESRIEKTKAEGKDTTVAANHLAKAKTALADAQATAAALAADAEDDVVNKEDAMKAKDSIKASLEIAKSELRLSVKALIELHTADKE